MNLKIGKFYKSCSEDRVLCLSKIINSTRELNISDSGRCYYWNINEKEYKYIELSPLEILLNYDKVMKLNNF